jgi:hypothetical protein
VKCSEDCEGYAELVEALECMLVVLRCVNDGMHQLGINGYPVRLQMLKETNTFLALLYTG